MPSANCHSSSVLVAGGTGAQGGAVARALLSDGVSVRVLVRDPKTASAQDLERQGAALVRGDLDDPSSLRAALAGVKGVFSVQIHSPQDPSAEFRQAATLIQAAQEAAVNVFVQTSVSGAGAHHALPGWNEGRWNDAYWDAKAEIEQAVMSAGFAQAVILRPAFLMENFIAPKSAWMFPDLVDGEISTAVDPATRVALVAAEDIGRMAVLAFGDPTRLAGLPVEMAGDVLTLPEIAGILSDAWGQAVVARTIDPAKAVAGGQSAGWVKTQEWLNKVGYPARPEAMRLLGVEPVSFAQWAARSGDDRTRRET